jgi:hypothetical protein
MVKFGFISAQLTNVLTSGVTTVLLKQSQIGRTTVTTKNISKKGRKYELLTTTCHVGLASVRYSAVPDL